MNEQNFFANVAVWWENMNWDTQLLYAIGGIALAVVCLQALASLIFGGDAGADGADFDIGDSPHDAGLGLISVRTVTAFFMGFGLGGGAILDAGHGLSLALGGGFGIGSVCTVVIFYIMKFLYSLRSSGTLKMESAIGATGTVYVPIPPRGQAGGQIEIMLQGRLMTVPAVANLEEKIPAGTPIRIAGMGPGNAYRVEKI